MQQAGLPNVGHSHAQGSSRTIKAVSGFDDVGSSVDDNNMGGSVNGSLGHNNMGGSVGGSVVHNNMGGGVGGSGNLRSSVQASQPFRRRSSSGYMGGNGVMSGSGYLGGGLAASSSVGGAHSSVAPGGGARSSVQQEHNSYRAATNSIVAAASASRQQSMPLQGSLEEGGAPTAAWMHVRTKRQSEPSSALGIAPGHRDGAPAAAWKHARAKRQSEPSSALGITLGQRDLPLVPVNTGALTRLTRTHQGSVQQGSILQSRRRSSCGEDVQRLASLKRLSASSPALQQSCGSMQAVRFYGHTPAVPNQQQQQQQAAGSDGAHRWVDGRCVWLCRVFGSWRVLNYKFYLMLSGPCFKPGLLLKRLPY